MLDPALNGLYDGLHGPGRAVRGLEDASRDDESLTAYAAHFRAGIALWFLHDPRAIDDDSFRRLVDATVVRMSSSAAWAAHADVAPLRWELRRRGLRAGCHETALEDAATERVMLEWFAGQLVLAVDVAAWASMPALLASWRSGTWRT